jgi:hypothetical protein
MAPMLWVRPLLDTVASGGSNSGGGSLWQAVAVAGHWLGIGNIREGVQLAAAAFTLRSIAAAFYSKKSPLEYNIPHTPT